MRTELILDLKQFTVRLLTTLLIGVISGAIAALFGRVLLAITAFRSRHSWPLIAGLPLAGLAIVWLYRRWGGQSIRGMSLLFRAGHGAERDVPLVMVPLVMLTTWLTHLFGGSAGREGVAVQIGGTIAYRIGKRCGDELLARDLLIVGMAAGFAGLFGTPLAATFFALEVLTVGRLMYHLIDNAMLAAFVASCTAQLLGLEKFSVNIIDTLNWHTATILKLALLGIIFGLTGRLFAVSLQRLKQRLHHWMPRAQRRILLCGVLLSFLLLILHAGRYAGLGTNLIADSFSQAVIYPYDWLIKLVLTTVTLAAGFQGGEVTPLFAIGASLGVALAAIFGMPVSLVAALGYAAVFSSATNTLIAPIFIGGEVFGYAQIPYFVIVCTVAYLINGNRTIYSDQRTLAPATASRPPIE